MIMRGCHTDHFQGSRWYFIWFLLFFSFAALAQMVSVEIPATVGSHRLLEQTNTASSDLQKLTDESLAQWQRQMPSPQQQWPHIDLFIFYTRNGEPLLPDLARKQKLQQMGIDTVARELAFTFHSPKYPWSPAEMDSLQAIIDQFYPLIKSVYGEPAFAITVNIKKDPELNAKAIYNTFTNEMAIRIPYGWQVTDFIDAIVHEMIHAFHDDLIIGLSGSFEEGMTRAAEIEVFNRSRRYHWDMNHSYTYDVYYEGLNKPAIGAKNGHFYPSNLTLLRYQMAGYAWAKLLIEDPNFLLAFNQRYYVQARKDADVRASEAKLHDIVRLIKPTVEGLPYDLWRKRQHIFDTHPADGYCLYTRLNQYTIDYFYRNASGQESGLAHAPIEWQIYDCHDRLLDYGSAITSTSGSIDFHPHFPPDYNGRLKIVASVSSPQGSLIDVCYRDSNQDIYGDGYGLYGIIEGRLDGRITIVPADPSLPRVTGPFSNGYFSFPLYKPYSGTFSFISDEADGHILKTITKDAASYFVHLPSNHPPLANIGGPYQGKAGDPIRFDASGSVDSDGDSLIFIWHFGDGDTATSRTVEHVYSHSGAYTVTLVVTDVHGQSDIDSTYAWIGFRVFGKEDDEGGDVFGEDWADRTIYPYLTSPPEINQNLELHFKAKISERRKLGYDFFGQIVTVNGSGGFYSAYGTWQPLKIADSTYRWYKLTLASDHDHDGVSDWKLGCNSVRIVTWSGYNELNPGRTSVDVLYFNRPPIACAEHPAVGFIGQPLPLSASASYDADGDSLAFYWDFDGSTSTGIQTTHVYADTGRFRIILTVTDDYRGEDRDTTWVTIHILTHIAASQHPSGFAVDCAWPNPFNSSMVCEYRLNELTPVVVDIYNIRGERIIRLLEQTQPPGKHRIVWNGRDEQGRAVAAGIYILNLHGGVHVNRQKLLLLH